MKKMRWFFAEFLVVVSGVLMAFLLNGWWIGIQDNKHQERYLNQIEGEIAETISLIRDAKDSQTERFKSLVVLVRAVYTKTDSLPPDSILSKHALNAMSFNTGSQVSATLSSMVSTGDMQLIEDDSLRALLVSGVEKLGNYDKQTVQQTFQWMVSTFEGFSNEIGIFDLVFSEIDTSIMRSFSVDSLSAMPSPDIFKRPPPMNWSELLNRRSFKLALENLFFAHSNLRAMHVYTEAEMEKFQKDFIRMRKK